MKYWKVETLGFRGNYISLMDWYVEYEDGTYLNISHTRHSGDNNDPGFSEYNVVIRKIDKLKLTKTQRLAETPKESVLRSLKKGLEILDLPKEINKPLKHNF